MNERQPPYLKWNPAAKRKQALQTGRSRRPEIVTKTRTLTARDPWSVCFRNSVLVLLPLK